MRRSRRSVKRPVVESDSSDEDTPKKKKTDINQDLPNKTANSNEENESSSSDSDIENYLKPAHKINLNSEFFDLKKDEDNSMEAIENNIFSGVDRLSDSDSDIENQKQDVENKEDIVQTKFHFEMPSTTQGTRLGFQQLQEYTKKIEEAKKYVELYQAKKQNEEKSNLDISNLLAMGETKSTTSLSEYNQPSLHSSDFDSCSDSEKEDWEEVKGQDVEKSKIPREGVQITLEMPTTMKKKKGVDLLTAMKRRLNKMLKENQVYIHQVHLLCWIAHGNYVNKILGNQTLLGLAMSLLPSQHCAPSKRIDLTYLEKIVHWFKTAVPLNEKKTNETFNLALRLKEQILKKQTESKKMLVYIFILILRSLGIQCRLVLSFQVEPLKPPSDRLHSLSSSKTDIKKQEEKEAKKDRDKITFKKEMSKSKQKINKSKTHEVISTENVKKEKVMPKNTATKSSTKVTSDRFQTKSKSSTKEKPEKIEIKSNLKNKNKKANIKAKNSKDEIPVSTSTKETEDKLSTATSSRTRSKNKKGSTSKSQTHSESIAGVEQTKSEGPKTTTRSKSASGKQEKMGNNKTNTKLNAKRSYRSKSKSPSNTDLSVPNLGLEGEKLENLHMSTRSKCSSDKDEKIKNENIKKIHGKQNQISKSKGPSNTNPSTPNLGKIRLSLSKTKKQGTKHIECPQIDGKYDLSDDEDILSIDAMSSCFTDTDTDEDDNVWNDSFNMASVEQLMNYKILQLDGATETASPSTSSQQSKKPDFKKLKNKKVAKCPVKSHSTRLKSIANNKDTESDDDFQNKSLSMVKNRKTSVCQGEKLKLSKLDSANNFMYKGNKEEKRKTISPQKTDSGVSKFFSPLSGKKQLDVRGDILSLMKKQLLDEKEKRRSRLVKKVRNYEDDDDDYIYEPMKKQKVESDDEFHEKPKTSKIKHRVIWKKERQNRKVFSSDSEEGKIKKKRGIDIWAEVYLEAEEKWISVDVVRGQVHCINEIHSRASHPVSYIIAWDNNNYLKDITSRYCPNWNTVTRKLRTDCKWWEDSLKPFRGPKTARDKEEDEDLARQHQEKPLPTTITEYKNHPLYVLKRHLLKFEAIYPPDAATLGFIRNEPVYSRDCVYTLHSRDIWFKEAKVVRLGEKPYKIVKARPKYDRLSNSMITDQVLEIFGPWQVEDYIPPTAENGIVPRNAYGNVELFKKCMLPKGTVHIQLPGLNKVAKKLNIDCAAAVVGFEYHSGWSHPVYDGFVVCEEHSDILIAAWDEEQEEAEKRAQEKMEKRVYGNWRRLIKGLLIRERLKARYNFGPVTISDEGKIDKKQKLVCKRRCRSSSSEYSSDD